MFDPCCVYNVWATRYSFSDISIAWHGRSGHHRILLLTYCATTGSSVSHFAPYFTSYCTSVTQSYSPSYGRTDAPPDRSARADSDPGAEALSNRTAVTRANGEPDV